MTTIFDLDVTGIHAKKSHNIKGDAHELYCRAIMMRLGFEVGKVDFSASSYDIIVRGFENFDSDRSATTFLRVQVKTIQDSLTFISGARGGVDREYKSDIKTRKLNTNDCDLFFGVDDQNLDIYLVPTIIATNHFGGSKVKNQLGPLKNRWDILKNWTSSYIELLEKELGLR